MARRISKHGNPHTDPLTRWGQRLSLGFFLAATFALILFSKAEIMVLERARIAAADVLTPVLSVVSLPVQAGRDGLARIGEAWDVYRRNQRLAEDNRRLREWQQLARHLQTENARLRAELGHVEETPRGFVTARVVADSSGAFARSLLINAGARDAVDRDQPVVAGGGLVGRVAATGSRSARILLLTDLNSRIPVTVGETGERAILAGDNSDILHLEYVADGAEIAVGDRIVTSGHGGVFPPGLAVGTVLSVPSASSSASSSESSPASSSESSPASSSPTSSKTGAITVAPVVDYARLTHVRVLQAPPLPAPDDPDDALPENLSVEGGPAAVEHVDAGPPAEEAE